MATIGSILIDGQDPDMPALRSFLANLDGRVGGALAQLPAAFVAGQTVILYAARSSLDGNLTPADRALGIVYNDGNNNGVYIKLGASGGGAWNATGLMLKGEKGEDGPQGKTGATGKSFLQTAIDTGYVPAGTTEAQLTEKIVGQITTAAVAARDGAVVARTGAETARAGSELARTQSQGFAGQSQTSAATADMAKQSVLDNLAGIDRTAGLQFQAVSRAALAAITNRFEGMQAYLGEPGAEGTFRWRGGDQSALVTADPFGFVYIPPAARTNGTLGVWARVIPLAGLPGGGEYQLGWVVTPTYGDAADVPWQSLVELLRITGAKASTIRVPNYTVTISKGVQANRVVGVTIRGGGPNSFVQIPPSKRGTAFWSTQSMLLVAKDATVCDFRMQADKHISGSGGGFCIQVTSNYTTLPNGDILSPKAPRATNIQIYGMTLHGCSEGILVFPDVDTAYPVGDERRFISPRGVKIHHNFAYDMDYQFCSMFCAEDVELTDNNISMVPMYDGSGNPISTRFQPTIRILGTHGFRVANNTIYGAGVTPAGNGLQFGIALMAANVTSSIPDQNIGRRQNRDGIITGNNVFNNKIGLGISECRNLLVCGNVFRNDLLNTYAGGFGISWAQGGDSTQFGGWDLENIRVIDNTFAGFAIPNETVQSTNFKSIEVARNKFISNAARIDGYMFRTLMYGSEKQFDLRIIDNDFLYPICNSPVILDTRSKRQIASFTASISGTLMTVSAVDAGTGNIAESQLVMGTGIAGQTRIVGPGPYNPNPALSGGAGGIGTYIVSVSQTAASGPVLSYKTSHNVVRGNTFPENTPQFGYIASTGVGTVSKGIGLATEEAGASSAIGNNERNQVGTFETLLA